MKKFLLKIISIFLIIVSGFCGYYGYLGYQIYQDKIEERSLSERVDQLKSKEDYVTLNQISPIYKEAVLESEDRRFYQHGPVDYYGLARAMFTNLTTFSFKEEIVFSRHSIVFFLLRKFPCLASTIVYPLL